MAINKAAANTKKRIDRPVATNDEWCGLVSALTTVVEVWLSGIVDNFEPLSGTPPVVVSRLPTEPGWIEDELVPAPVELPAVCGSWVAFWVPLPVLVMVSFAAIYLIIAVLICNYYRHYLYSVRLTKLFWTTAVDCSDTNMGGQKAYF